MSDEALSTPLTNCDREAIHLLGAIQPIGFLAEVSADLLIARVSENIAEFLERPACELLGASLRDVFTVGAPSRSVSKTRRSSTSPIPPMRSPAPRNFER